MTSSTAQNICQIFAAICGSLALLFGYGSYYFGNKAKSEKETENQTVQAEQFEEALKDRQQKNELISRKIDEAILELKNFIVQGDKSLVDKIPRDADWDLKQGSIYLVVSPPLKGSLGLKIQSKSTDAFLDFKISAKSALFIYHKSELGTISKVAKVVEKDFKDERRLILVTFIWDFEGEKISIHINDKKRA